MNNLRKPHLLRFAVQEQILFCKRLAMLMRSGIPLSTALSMLDAAHRNKSSAYLYARIIEDVSRGASLSKALTQFKGIFGEFAIDIIRVGEQSGSLSNNLDYLAEELKKKDALRKKVIGALIYPAIIVCATIAIALVLTMYIFPKITPVFKSFGQKLPLSTRVLIALSGFLLHRGIAVLLVGVALFVAGALLVKKTRVGALFDRMLLRIPVVGRVSRAYHAGNAMRSLGLLLQADLRIVQALEITAQSARNTLYRTCLFEMAHQIARGQKLSTQMRRFPRLVSPLSAQMVQTGEETGNLPESLLYITELYEEEIGDLTKNLTTMLEPLLMITMGLVVGFIAISIITPIYGITQTLSPH